ncbi:head-tail connector protein [Bacillus sp. Hm123]|uniref:head-tail connector protein n=1 Tax=Bacillus sp. Hm123 TaxID=3450745 RepID=UPI003F43A718
MMLTSVKKSLRVSHVELDDEITDLIEAARHDLMLSGISSEKANNDTDPLIKRAIVTYCKANFGYDNPEADRFGDSYKMLKQHLSLAGDYREPVG